MKNHLCFLFIVLFSAVPAQSLIQGKLLNSEQQPISGVSVSLSPEDSDDILAYAISDKNGGFSIEVNSEISTLKISIRSMDYAMVSEVIENKNQTLNFYLTEQAIELKDVVVKASPIRQRGDTLNYSVNTFAKEHDRSIADVIARMPGIEIQSNGQILYQGKPINKYYIDNLDMLEGRYNLANKNLAHKEVASVQVYENHQPIKILDSLVYSDRAALNIQLKNSFTFTGQAELGLGASPLLWDANITPMLFARNKQMLTTYQTNNTGNNVAEQFTNFSLSSLLNPVRINLEKKDWVGIQSLSTPNFPDKRWLDNNIHATSTNFLYKLKKDYEVKFNISYLNDYQKLKGATTTRFYTANDTIQLNETQFNQLYFNSLDANLILHKNTKKNYLKNTLELQGFWDGERGGILNNNENIGQQVENHYFKLANTLTSIIPIGKQLMNLNSYVGIDKTPQNLRIDPGQFINLLNQNMTYDLTTQNVAHQQFVTTNSLGFNKGIKHFTFSPSIGFQLMKQSLNSSIFVDETELTESVFNNDLDWTQTKAFAQLLTEYKKKKWRLSLMTPVIYSNYNISDDRNELGQNINQLSFQPSFNVYYEPSAFWKFNIGSNYSESLGDIHQLHYAYLMNNYRNIQKISAPLPESQIMSYRVGMDYKNPIKSLFWNIQYSHSNLNNNLLYATQIQDNGATEITAIQEDNKQLSHQVSSRISKYFGRLGANLSLKGSLGYNFSEQVINQILTDVKSQNMGFNAKIEKDISEALNVEINSNWTFFKNSLQNQSNAWITRQEHQFKLNAYPKENQFVGLTTEWSRNDVLKSNKDYFFADLLYRYTWKKAKLDFELEWNNIFNSKDYSILSIDTYSYVETNFRLRPSQVLLKVRFSL
ncbi:carboxypeptidase-like regulatory domain-containing protein [Weeksellaceae bacterium KMM 9724]|uniref:hypothetical protein n=1 Tax=Profundicola chukchiensis TaxID=2961959 RepID=UPI00243D88B5|nr:hypothetical protein [Profundicola chukchiensis]MDG4950462.1 carboxypeptidase-like regulatory domain-containing protein [Profundicola chukchiensis]